MREEKAIGEGMQPGVDEENEGEAGCTVRLKAGMLAVRSVLQCMGISEETGCKKGHVLYCIYYRYRYTTLQI